MTLFLVGMPGSGKSTIGPALALRLGAAFEDLDTLVADHAQQSIPELFKALGESGFRALEAQVLTDWLAAADPAAQLVLATGGGTPCFHDNMDRLNQAGLTCWLDPPIDVLVQRLASASHRPLLQRVPGQSLHDRVLELYELRNRFYAQAKCRITETKLEAVVDQVLLAATGGLAPPPTVQ